MWALVENGEIKKFDLPKTGKLKDGRTVSGYNLLPEEVLRDEGWLPVEDNPPEVDPETQVIVVEGYEILPDKVVKQYRVIDKPAAEAEQPKTNDYKQRLLDIEMALAAIMGVRFDARMEAADICTGCHGTNGD